MPLLVYRQRRWIILAYILAMVGLVGLWTRYAAGKDVRVFLAALICLSLLLRVAHGLSNKRLRKQFVEREFRICSGCGYDLGGHNEAGQCPECGRPFSTAALVEEWKDWVN